MNRLETEEVGEVANDLPPSGRSSFIGAVREVSRGK